LLPETAKYIQQPGASDRGDRIITPPEAIGIFVFSIKMPGIPQSAGKARLGPRVQSISDLTPRPGREKSHIGGKTTQRAMGNSAMS
jgi:hypothetical protein